MTNQITYELLELGVVIAIAFACVGGWYTIKEARAFRRWWRQCEKRERELLEAERAKRTLRRNLASQEGRTHAHR